MPSNSLIQILFVANVVLVSTAVGQQGVESTVDQNEFFEKRVRPVLVANCVSCHGAKKQEADLRLDSRDAILKGGEGGPIVVSGDPGSSRLIDAVRHGDELQMPPERKLKASEIAALERWVDYGLPWPNSGKVLDIRQQSWETHWAFQPVVKVAPPLEGSHQHATDAIDCFVLSRLKSGENRTRESAADRTLIRRATSDLTGLPATPDEVNAFVTDSSPDAYERLLDRLLASPRYGERWARHWLDVARYADNKGYVFFEDKKYPWAYTYRDYVIGALNADLPYDRFVTEQIAADQLDLNDDRRPLAAMGFLTLGGHFMNNTHDIIDDRIDVVTRGLLGLTVTCARCHDHKYDPIPQADYYSLYGVFRSSYEPTVPPQFQPPPKTDEYHKFQVEMESREKKLRDFVVGKHAELVSDARKRIAQYMLAAHTRRGRPAADDFMLLIQKGDLNPTMVQRWQTYLEDTRLHPRIWAPWRELSKLAAGEFSEKAVSVLERMFASGVEPQVNPLVRDALSEPASSVDQVAQQYAKLLTAIDKKWRTLLENAKKRNSPIPLRLAKDEEEELRLVLYGADAPPDTPLVMDWGFLSLFPDRPTQGEYKKLLKSAEEWSSTGPGAPPRAMVLLDSAVLYNPRVFGRGNPNRLGAQVPRQFLAMLEEDRKPFASGSGRLELAKAIASSQNPLTSRVIVNRIWMHHFGRGLVTTPSDFGLRSDSPTDPQLLDWLAATFVDRGWSIKNLHRRIMASASYRQTAAGTPSDTGMRTARRLEFEAQRDALLAVAGQLEQTMGGPPVKIFEGGATSRRRSVYGFINRMDVSPLLTTFDFPNPAATSPGRSRTTVAPQALYVMNNMYIAEMARHVVQRQDIAGLDAVSKVGRVYTLLFGRMPSEEETQLALDYLGDEPDTDHWSQLVHALLMTNEFVFVD